MYCPFSILVIVAQYGRLGLELQKVSDHSSKHVCQIVLTMKGIRRC